VSDLNHAAWMREHGLSSEPATPRWASLAEEIQEIDRIIERAEATKKHAPTKRDSERIDEKLDRLETRAVELREELSHYRNLPGPFGSGQPFVNGDPIPPTCTICGSPIGNSHEADYGVCRNCTTPPSLTTGRS